jgi:hypothetical protein
MTKTIEGDEPVPRPVGVCNFCNDVARVYEQEDEYRKLFVLCMRCIRDITASRNPYNLYRDPEE